VSGRQTHDKSVVAVEIASPRRFGRVRLRRVADASRASLMDFITEAVERGSEIRTDGLAAYRELPQYGYRHTANVVTGCG
jgi:hypothetical protein